MREHPVRRRTVAVATALVLVLVVLGGGIAYALMSGRRHGNGSAAHPMTAAAPGSPSAGGAGSGGAATGGAASGGAATGGAVAGGAAGGAATDGSGSGDGPGVGVFISNSPTDVAQFGAWLGDDVHYVVDFSERQTWDDIANPIWALEPWQGSGYRLVYGVAMLPEAKGDPSTLAAGAAGDYDQYYRTLAQNLVTYGQGDAVIRLGWEFNLPVWRWHPDDPQDFIAYWRNVVTTMRSVPGAEHLAFDWNVNNGGRTYDSTRFYPGGDYVDYVGVDVYDISAAEGTYPYPADCARACRRERQKAAWKVNLDSPFGLKFWSRFAASQGKPMSFPEWGLWERPDGRGGGDDPYFIARMHEFITDPANNVAYQAYFEYDVGVKGLHALSSLPTAGATYRRLFGR